MRWDSADWREIQSHHGYISEPFYTFTMFEGTTKKDRDMCIPTFYDRSMHDLCRMLFGSLGGCCVPAASLQDRQFFFSAGYIS